MFPRLPLPSKLRKMWAGARLHLALSAIIHDRRRTGRVDIDAMQALMDDGHSDIAISVVSAPSPPALLPATRPRPRPSSSRPEGGGPWTAQFIIGALFAGLINSTFTAAWVLSHLADKPEWYARVRAEVDAVLSRHRRAPDEPVAAVVARLPLDAWEADFPLVDLAVRETIRLDNQGVAMRKNVSGKDVEIGFTGQVIPKDAFAVCHVPLPFLPVSLPLHAVPCP